MKTIRWGMIGCGDVAEVKSGPGFYKARNSTLIAVMRRNGELAADYARRHNVPRWHDDADAIIGADDIDAVYIATRPDSHRDYVLRAAASGKAVYVEKPMGMNHAECLEMIEASRRHGVPLFVAYYRRAMPYFLKVRELIEEGTIGPVRMVITRHFARLPPRDALAEGRLPWRVDPAHGSGGFFFEAVCHNFDMLDFLFGPVVRVSGLAANKARAYPPEDTVAAHYVFASGVHGCGAWCFATDRDDEVNEVIGADSTLTFHPFSFRPISVTRGAVARTYPVETLPHVQQPLIQSIVDELNGVGRCPSTGETAARTAAVIDEILAEYKASRAPV
jgi:predicted dehydrogenase